MYSCEILGSVAQETINYDHLIVDELYGERENAE
jgi:hypothetical protein